MMKRSLLYFLIAAFCAVTAVAAQAQQKAVPDATAGLITMFSGEVRTLPITKVQRVAVGNGRLLTTTVLDNEVLLLAEGPGDTGLYIWLKDGTLKKYQVRISPNDVAETQRQIQKILSGFSGVRVERVGDHVVVSGETTKENLARINLALGQFKQVLNMAREEAVTMRKMIYLKVQLIEFKKSALENLGIKWATSIDGPAGAFAGDLISNSQFRFTPQQRPDQTFTQGGIPPLPSAILQGGLPARVSPARAYLGIATTITSQINLAVQNGDAYVLATPELSTRSGGEAKFLAGGQIPIITPASGLNAATVTYKDYGIKLSIKPVADAANDIMATIKTELSAIDPATTVQGNPGFLTRQTDSDINVKDGQTIVMSGLVNADLSNTIDKFPWLGDLPIIGALFRSTNFRANRTDLVVFVTPQIFDPNSTLNRERIEKAKDLRERYEGFIGKKGIVE